MNLIDSFFFMFEADVSKLKKGTDEGEASAKKLKKTVDAVDLSAEKLAANFVNMAKNAASALAGVLALGAIKSLVNDSAALTAATALQARATGMSVEAMSAYQVSVIAMGGSSDQAAETLSKLRDGFVEVARFGTMGVSPMTMAFQSLGASAQTMRDAIKDPTVALSAIADNFSKLNRTQQIFLGQKLGLDQGTIMLLSQGRVAFDELIAKQKELHAITQEQADAAVKYTIAQKELGLTFEAVKREIATDLLPAFTWVVQRLDLMITWLREHKAVAIATFAAIGAVVATVLVPPLITAAAAMWAFIAPILAMAAPFIAVGVAIGLLIDDIEKFRAGQASLIGEVLARWPIIGQVARSVAQIVQMSWKLIVDAIKWAGGLLMTEGVNAWNKYKSALQPVIDLFDKGVSLVEKLWSWLSKFKDIPANVLNWIGHGLASLTGGHYDDVGTATNAPTPAASPQRAARAANTPNGRMIADKLVASGQWTREQAAGIAGSFMQESGGTANAVNSSSGAYGLGQWLGSRVKDFEKWAGKPLQGSSLDDQIAFFNYETSHKEKRAGDMIRAAATPEAASEAHARYYERPGAHEINLARRAQYADMIYAGQSQMAGADNAPLAQPGAIATAINAARSGGTQVTVGDIHVSGAKDPKATAQAVREELQRHINNAIDQHDDGIAG